GGRIGTARRGGAHGAAFRRAPLRGAELALDLVVVLGNAAGDERDRGHRRARIRIARRRLEERPVLLGALLGARVRAAAHHRIVVDEGAARTVDGAAHEASGLHRARIGEAAGRARDGAALVGTVGRRSVFTLDAVVVGNAARDLAVVVLAVGHVAVEDVVAVLVAHRERLAARIEPEERPPAARGRAEDDLAGAARVGRERADLDAAHYDVV